MIELKLIPDGATEVPAEATDDGILATYLQNNAGPLPDTGGTVETASSWRDIERSIPAHREFVAVRVPGEAAAYSEQSLNGIRNALVDNITGLKAHPNGWEAVDDEPQL